MSKTLLHALASGGIAVAIDKYALNEPNLQNSLVFGSTVAAGIFLGDIVSAIIPNETKGAFLEGRAIESRILEIAGTAGVAYGASQYLGKTILQYNAPKVIAAVVVSDISGAFVADALEFLL